MTKLDDQYWQTEQHGIAAGARYTHVINDALERPDPASRFQPEGVHAPSQVIDHTAFTWNDLLWKNIDLDDAVIYELHVGTFTPEGTFDAIIPVLSELASLGITALELMPVAQFPGERNWGYDGTYPYAVQNSYGGPSGLKQLTDACHAAGLAVILDVVYNHFGPEGCYCRDYGPYYTDRYTSPWGDAINYDDAYNDGVRNFFIENALAWFEHYHIDALRLDAVHGIYDLSARPFLRQLADEVYAYNRRSGKRCYLIAESDLNDAKIVRSRDLYGYGHDAQWNDDFHHAVHALLTRENSGYYQDYGSVAHLAKAMQEGFVYSGQYSRYRRKAFGNSSREIPANRFVVFTQNHDQTGNRMRGDRLTVLTPFESLKLAAGVLLLSPFIPLLFMGEEYGEENPFLYFVSHSDESLLESVRRGRAEEFAAFAATGAIIEDPAARRTFLHSVLQRDKRHDGHHKVLYEFYRALLQIRKRIPALSGHDKDAIRTIAGGNEPWLYLLRWQGESSIFAFFNFAEKDLIPAVPVAAGTWRQVLCSADRRWRGPGVEIPGRLTAPEAFDLPARSFALFEKADE
jgi:maltooligosyltrehalose trehalohydrolase